ncbi:MAG: pyridoxamine 5'-phosphate oxidase family protein [Candidatus Shapirobacteria bacterium]|jgi:general stress protein 26
MNKDQILQFIKKQSLAVLSTATPSGKTESAVMAIAGDNWEIYMSTESDTRKIPILEANSQASLLVGGLSSPSVQLDGHCFICSNSDADFVKSQILAIHPDTKDYLTPTSVFLKFVPSWARFSDFSQNPPTIVEINL